MSYEGSIEHICKNGHYWICEESYDYEIQNEKCPTCESKWKFFRRIDETNGICKDDPNTYPAEKFEIGFTETKHIDHRGNEYFLKHTIYRPANEAEWQQAKEQTHGLFY